MRLKEIMSKTRQDVISNRPEAYLVYMKSDKARLMPGARLFSARTAERAV
jgi:hypothetical protein